MFNYDDDDEQVQEEFDRIKLDEKEGAFGGGMLADDGNNYPNGGGGDDNEDFKPASDSA
jgi:hypothetical protein